MKVVRFILAIGQAFLTFIGICIIGIFFYSEITSPYNWIVAITFGALGIYLGIKVYRMIIRRGYISTISGDNSSYYLDDLKPTPGSGVIELQPNELENYFDHGKVSIKEGTISIWGDWNGRQLNQKHKLSTIEYDNKRDVLSIYFSDYCQLQIRLPSSIHCSESYLKIFKAKEVKWQTFNDNREYDQFHYLNTGKDIVTKSNTNWKPKVEDLGIGMHAVYIQG